MGDATPLPAGSRSRAVVATPNASRYLQQLGKHFAHKVPATFDPQRGEIAFPIGTCGCEAREDRLALSLTAPDEARLSQLQEVVESHLLRFAFREPLEVEWRPA